ncbi:hypothetical protein BGX26_007496, partial [Mortierella sp. AD094]
EKVPVAAMHISFDPAMLYAALEDVADNNAEGSLHLNQIMGECRDLVFVLQNPYGFQDYLKA